MNLLPLDSVPTPIHLQVVSITPGRIRVRVAHQHREQQVMAQIASALKGFFPQIDRVRSNAQTGSITIYYSGDSDSFTEALTTLQDLGIIVTDAPMGKSQAAVAVTSAIANLNQRFNQATAGSVDLRFLFPLLLSVLALRQILTKSPGLKTSPWYVLAWYAFDSFMKLNNTKESPQSNDH
jgi:Heavy metal associated domain 2